MPNIITSALGDIASSALSSKLNPKGDKHSHPHQHGGSSSGIGSVLNKTIDQTLNQVKSSLSSLTSSHSSKQQPQGYQNPAPIHSNYNQDMSGGGYPGYSNQQQYPGGYGMAPPFSQGGYPGQPGGYPAPAYPPQQQPGYPDYGLAPIPGFGFADASGYPPPQQQPYPPPQQQPYPSAYPPQLQPYDMGGGYQPNVGPAPNAYPSAAPPYGSRPYNTPQQQSYPPPQTHQGVYPTQAVDSVRHYYSSAPQQQQRPGTAMATGNPTIKPNPNFNASASAEMLRKAMKGFGCDKNKVIQALTSCNNWQRQEISTSFKVQYGKDLITDLKSELSGDFEDLVLALMEPPARYDAQQLYKAMAGLGTKESVLIEIMTTRTNAQIHQLKATYKQMYGSDLERDLIGETSGYFKRLLVSLCAGGRDESYFTDPLKANQDARSLYRAGEKRLGTDESTFNSILAAQNPAQLRMVFDEYQKVSGHSIEQALQSEFSGDILDGLMAVVKSIRNRPFFFAELLYNSMKGIGTRDNDLIRLVVSRSEIDLGDIRNEYQRHYNTSLEKGIAGDCSGSYKEGLISVVRGN